MRNHEYHDTDYILHDAAVRMIYLKFKTIEMPEERKEVVVEYYYCGYELYLLRFTDGTFVFHTGTSPYDAWMKWNLEYEHKLEKEDNE